MKRQFFPGILERLYQPLYDTVQITEQTESVTFFRTGIADGKTISETNIESAEGLPTPKSFQIRGFSVKPNLTADINQVKKFADGAWFRLFIGTKDYLVIPLSLVLDLPPKEENPILPKDYESNLDLELINLLLKKKKENQPVFELPDDATITLMSETNYHVNIYKDKDGSDNKLQNGQKFSGFSLQTILHGYMLREVY